MFKSLDETIKEAFLDRDELSFKEYLNFNEERQFQAEEDNLQFLRMQLIKKYNKIVSDRLSHNTLIEEVQKVLFCHCEEMRVKLDVLDNKTLQQILSIALLAQKKNQCVAAKES